MKPIACRPSILHRPAWPLGALACLIVGGLSGCAASSSSGEASSPVATKSAEETSVQENVPDVNQCHTDTQVCPLPEPLQPGLGCFCDKGDGTKEAGTAGS